MKKLISLILAVLMLALCACGIAEETEGSGNSSFLRIKEGVTAKVFKEPDDDEPVDTLAAGRICGLLDEGVSVAGKALFQVFYLNSQKKGAAGYISVEDAEKLTADQLKALMEDPAVLNEILDLIEAMDAFLDTDDGDTGETRTNKLGSLYQQAMDKLKSVFSTDLSSELGSLEEQGKELADKAKEAGKDLLDKAKETGKDLLDQAKDVGKDLKDSVTDVLSSADGKDIGKTLGNLKDSLSDVIGGKDGKTGEKIEKALDNVSTMLKKANTYLGKESGDSIDGLADLMNNAKDWLNGVQFDKMTDAVNDLSDVFKLDGFTQGLGKDGVGSFIDEMKSIFSGK